MAIFAGSPSTSSVADFAQPGMAKITNTLLYADGKLTITDTDSGEDSFRETRGFDYHGQYGQLRMLADGTWHYNVHLGGASGSAIDQLGAGQRKQRAATLAREAELSAFQHDPEHALHHHGHPLTQLFGEFDYDGYKWAMAIDLNSCIGCNACSRFSDLIQIKSNLPVLDYDQYDPLASDFSQSLEKCPMESLVWVGKPSAEDLAAVADEELPERVEADFETTVDKTRWWG